MLATTVLAAGVTHLTDARYFAAWEVDYLAFPVGAHQPNAVDWTTLAALREWITGPTLVAELGNVTDGADWARQLADHDLTLALISHTAPASAPEALAAAGVGVFVHLPVAGYQSADDVAEALVTHPSARYVVLDFEAGGITWRDLTEGHPFGLDELDGLLRQRPVLLQIGLDGADPKALASDHPLNGFAVRGSSEEKVGYKSFDDLDGLFEGLETFA